MFKSTISSANFLPHFDCVTILINVLTINHCLTVFSVKLLSNFYRKVHPGRRPITPPFIPAPTGISSFAGYIVLRAVRMELFTAQVLVELRIVDSIRLIPEVAINYRVAKNE